jgi:hypothetical protein
MSEDNMYQHKWPSEELAVEIIAIKVFSAMWWVVQQGEKDTPEWHINGNSFAQQRAREAAKEAIEALGVKFKE